jgi:mannosyltransferase
MWTGLTSQGTAVADCPGSLARVSLGVVGRDQRSAEPGAFVQRLRVSADPAIAAVVGLTALAVVVRFVGIGHQGFWFDEANTSLLVHFSPGKMLGLIPQTESTPPLYYCIAWVWARVFGYGEAGLRSLSALAGALTVPLVYAAGAKLISRRAGLIAAALTACNPFLIWYSQEARSYALLVMLSALALLAFAYALAEPKPRTLAAWVIATALCLATHYYAVLAIAPQAIWLLAAHRRDRSVAVAIAAVGVCGLALVPLAISQNQTGHASWIAQIPLLPRLRQIFPQFLIGTGAPAQGVLEPIAAALVALALVLLVVCAAPGERRRSLTLGSLALCALAINLVLVALGIDDLITRNVIVIWLPAALMVAGGLGAGRRNGGRAAVVGSVAAVALCAIGIFAAVGVASDRNLQRPDWRAVARVLGTRPSSAGGRVILIQHYRDLLPLSLYLPGLRAFPARVTRVSEVDVVSISAPRVRLCWWGAACNLTSSTLQSSYALPGFRVVWRRRALQFTILRLVASRPVGLTARVVSAALRTTSLRHDALLVQRP